MKTIHTPEPWHKGESPDAYLGAWVVRGKRDGAGCTSPIVCNVSTPMDQERIVSCVNACAGMADPAAEMKALRAATRKGKSMTIEIRQDSIEISREDQEIILRALRQSESKLEAEEAVRASDYRNAGLPAPVENCALWLVRDAIRRII